MGANNFNIEKKYILNFEPRIKKHKNIIVRGIARYGTIIEVAALNKSSPQMKIYQLLKTRLEKLSQSSRSKCESHLVC